MEEELLELFRKLPEEKQEEYLDYLRGLQPDREE